MQRWYGMIHDLMIGPHMKNMLIRLLPETKHNSHHISEVKDA